VPNVQISAFPGSAIGGVSLAHWPAKSVKRHVLLDDVYLRSGKWLVS
jgi:hypothetical protein